MMSKTTFLRDGYDAIEKRDAAGSKPGYPHYGLYSVVGFLFIFVASGIVLDAVLWQPAMAQERLQLAQDQRDSDRFHIGRWLVADAAQDRHWLIEKGLVKIEDGCAKFHDEDGNRWILPLSSAITIIEMKGQNFPEFFQKHGYNLGITLPTTVVEKPPVPNAPAQD